MTNYRFLILTIYFLSSYSYSASFFMEEGQNVHFSMDLTSQKTLNQTARWPVLQNVGEKAFPYQSEIVVGRPEDIRIQIQTGEILQYKGNVPLANAQKCRCSDQVDQTYKRDKDAKDRVLVEKTYLGDFRGIPLTKIEVTPFFNQSGQDYYYSKVDLVLEKTEVFNGEQLNLLSEVNTRMVIITPHQFLNSPALFDYVQHKKKFNIEVVLVDLSSIGKTFSDLKSWVEKEYKRDERKMSYLVLLGDEKAIPTDYVETTFDRNTPSDLALSTMGGEQDLIPDIYLSRVSVQDEKQLEEWVKQVITYDEYIPSTKKKTRILALASNEGANPSDVDYVQEMAKKITDKFNVVPQYFFQQRPESTAENIFKAIDTFQDWEEGVSFINYIGHGTGYSWPSVSGREFSTTHINRPKSKEDLRTPILVDVACQNGRFSGEDRFGEAFLSGSHRLIGYYGGTVNISWDPPAIMAIGINDALKPQQKNILGAVLLQGQLYLMKNYSDIRQVQYNLMWYHLQGDPSIDIKF